MTLILFFGPYCPLEASSVCFTLEIDPLYIYPQPRYSGSFESTHWTQQTEMKAHAARHK